MPHEIVFDLSKAHIMEMPNRLTVRGGEVFETEVEVEVLDPPELDSAVAGDTVVDLAWTASTSEGITGYKVKYGTETGVYTVTEDAGDVLEYQVEGLTNDTEYFFVITAYSVEDESENSNELSATPEAGALIEDTFTDDDGTSIDAHTPDTGPTPVLQSGTGDIQSNQLRFTADSSAITYEANEADVTVEVDWILAVGEVNRNTILLRFVDTINKLRFLVREDNGDWQISEVLGGAFTVRDAGSFAFTEGQTYRLKAVVNGATVTVFIDGQPVGSFDGLSNTTSTKHGLERTTGSNATRLDNFLITA